MLFPLQSVAAASGERAGRASLRSKRRGKKKAKTGRE